MDSPLVTVFVPVYNSEQYLVECIESIINQTYKNLDILFVDDGSTDHSVNIVKEYLAKDSRIRLIENGENMGIPYTRNIGLKEARGKYMAIMDSDDIAMPERIEKQISYLESNPDIDVVGSFYIMFDGNSEKRIEIPVTRPEEIKIMLMFHNPIANSSTTVRLESIRKNNLRYNLDHFVGQDYGLWANLSKVGKLAILPEYLMKYRHGHNNVTKKSINEKALKRKAVLDGIRSDLLRHYGFKLNDEDERVILNYFSKLDRVITLNDIFVAIQRIKKINREKEIFDQSTFLHILDEVIFMYLIDKENSIYQKIALYSKLRTRKKTFDVLYLVIKHFYQLLKK